MSAVFVSGADARYGSHLLNLLGSVKANSDIFERAIVFDLGLLPRQRRLIDAVRGVEVRTVPPFVPHWQQGRTWKTWIWTHVDAPVIFWLDAGATVLRSLAEPLEQVERNGYFVVAQGHPVADTVPTDYYGRYGITTELDGRESIAAGILAFPTRGRFYDEVVVPTFDDARAGLSLGFSAGEVEKLNQGMDRMDDVVVRDCRLFRHEQTLLGIHFYKTYPDPHVNDLWRYGGWLSRHEHPEQLIWSHRRRTDYRYLSRVPYFWRAKPRGLAFAARRRGQWLRRQHEWKLRPKTYLAKLNALMRR